MKIFDNGSDRVEILVTPQERLIEAGLTEYIPLAKKVSEYKEKYGDIVGSWYERGAFPFMKELTDTLTGITEGTMQPDDEKARFWSLGWGTDKERATVDARVHVANIEIVSANSIGFETQVDHTLQFLTEILPGIVLAYPDTVKQTQSGGYYDIDHTHIGISHDKPAKAIGYRNLVAIHEGKHAVDYAAVPKIKKYVDKKAFADHATILFESTMETLDEWIDTPIKRLAELKQNIFGMREDSPEEARETIIRLVEQTRQYVGMFDKHGFTEPLEMDDNSSEMDRLYWDYQVITHAIMKTWKHLRQNDQNHPFLADPNIQAMVKDIIGEVAHGFVFNTDELKSETPHGQRQREVFSSTLNAFGTLRTPTIEEYFIAGRTFEFEQRQKKYEQFGMKLVASDDSDEDYHIPHRIYSIPKSTKYYCELTNVNEDTLQFIFELPVNDLEGRTGIIEPIIVSEAAKTDSSGNPISVRTPYIIYRREGESEGRALILTNLDSSGNIVQPSDAPNEGIEMEVPILVEPYPSEILPYTLNVRNIDGEVVDAHPTGALIVQNKVFEAPMDVEELGKEVLLIKGSVPSAAVDRDLIILKQGEGGAVQTNPILIDRNGTKLNASFGGNPSPILENSDRPGQIMFIQENSRWGVQLNEESQELFRIIQSNPNIVAMQPRLTRNIIPGSEDFIVGQELVLFSITVDGVLIENNTTIPLEEIFIIK